MELIKMLFKLILPLLLCFAVGTKGVPVEGSKFKQVVLHNHGNLDYAKEDAEPIKVDDSGSRMRRDSPDALFGDPVEDITNLLNFKTKGKKGESCKACKTAVGLVKFLVLSNKTDEELLQFASAICLDLSAMMKPLCEGLLKINGPSLLHIIKTSGFSAAETCNFLLKFDCDEEVTIEDDWRVDIPASRKNTIIQTQHPETTAKPLKVLHISDTHFDPHFEEGVPDICPFPLCCREKLGNVNESTSLSGKWGGWKCDIPERTLDNLLEHLSQAHQVVDYVIWTGDIPPHDAWSMKKDESLSIMKKTVEKIVKTFPNIPVYPALGNHEAVPPNLFPPSSIDERWSVNWLYKEIEKQWLKWLPEDTVETIRRGAFYTVLNRPGLRIVSLNTNYCYYANWWLMLNSTDPEQELKWLTDVLLQAEEKGEKVQIIGHIPPGHKDCLKTWQTNYYDIIERFSESVVGQFFGHTHTDEFEIFYDREKSEEPVNVAYVAPSVTTYTYLNPGYRIYYIDGDHEATTRAVVDHDTWYMDFEEANQKEIPTWRKLYSAKEAFNMTSLSPKDWHEVYSKMALDDDLFDSYDRFFWSNSRKRPNCQADCKKARLCGIRSCIQYGTVEASTEIITETTTN